MSVPVQHTARKINHIQSLTDSRPYILLLLTLGIIQTQLLPHCSLDLSCQRILQHKNLWTTEGWFHVYTHARTHRWTHRVPHHGVQAEGMEASGRSSRVVPVPQVLQLLLGFMQHLDTLWIFLLQLLELCIEDIKMFFWNSSQTVWYQLDRQEKCGQNSAVMWKLPPP